MEVGGLVALKGGEWLQGGDDQPCHVMGAKKVEHL